MKNVNLSNELGIDTVLFDLDGTILPLDGDDFERTYLTSITQKVAHIIEPEAMAKALWKSSAAMIQNTDIFKTNEQVFYDCFETLVGTEIKTQIDAILDDYYEHEYDIVETVTSISKPMVDAVYYLREKGYKVILATNPLFPKLATDKRIWWSGLELDDFDDITRFEKNHHCKPNPMYYEEIISDNKLDPNACLMIGNDVEEDMMASQFGMKTWLLTDNLIHRGSDYHCDWMGSREELIKKIKELF
ncbi:MULTISPECIES: HAD family hydrolase [Erysipelothrix]|uniref:HAD family hydrolase n=1 Tax=Erysipelothrix piscisicarius TaxID=2485784 RepID=A0A3Q8S2R4_9FIRM|nr:MULTISPECIES: HAD family hydrolase [Erysipelothrix]AZK44152.1 HAD family hydrolase [Erysipelothrix piscisicarius]MBK2402904.1 HAD family hydrolase [Erysipelothrix sp. strain 2 (EsS2-6-Brazil)]MBK2404816.1 HAD family hydrolase [Erysipelothrix sp. strain 2 (EsS2-7-Brazil)]NBA01925.1 HAD hydrolase-like protein [Erysipelothrix rhusiopathiae]